MNMDDIGDLPPTVTKDYLEKEIDEVKSRIAALRLRQENRSTKTVQSKSLMSEVGISPDILIAKASRLTAEIRFLEDERADELPNDEDFRLAFATSKMKESENNLKLLLKVVRAENDHAQWTCDNVKENLKLAGELSDCLLNCLEKEEGEGNTTDEERRKNLESDLFMKYQRAKKDSNYYSKKLYDFLVTNFPTPGTEDIRKHKKKNPRSKTKNDDEHQYMSLVEIIQLLVNKFFRDSNPYISIDESMWPPYIELLLRSHVGVRHPDNQSLICLENFLEK